jgi:hypothetical protein
MQPILPNATTNAINPMMRNHGFPAMTSTIPAPKIKAMIKYTATARTNFIALNCNASASGCKQMNGGAQINSALKTQIDPDKASKQAAGK